MDLIAWIASQVTRAPRVKCEGNLDRDLPKSPDCGQTLAAGSHHQIPTFLKVKRLENLDRVSPLPPFEPKAAHECRAQFVDIWEPSQRLVCQRSGDFRRSSSSSAADFGARCCSSLCVHFRTASKASTKVAGSIPPNAKTAQLALGGLLVPTSRHRGMQVLSSLSLRF
jgi:hypothetical protein